MTIASQIKRARTAAGLTQRAVADALGMTSQSVSDWERGSSEPQSETLQRLAKILKTQFTIG
jgi:transcriptional regulator with XRE-family HTH domain